jgi:hypothetical protein
VPYQERWVEQTPYAIGRLREVMAENGMQLVLPVSDVGSKEEAETELRKSGLSACSLELKCSRQQADPGLTGLRLQAVVDNGIESLRSALERNPGVDPLQRIDFSGGHP